MTPRLRTLAIVLALVSPITSCTIEVRRDQEHMGQRVDLAVYPDARLATWEEPAAAYVSFSGTFADTHVVSRSFDSDDVPEVILQFYRNAMRAYGAVTECRGTINVRRRRGIEKLVCIERPASPAVQLAVAVDGRHPIVVVKPRGTAARFAILYVHTRG
jgi:hypothetical protein